MSIMENKSGIGGKKAILTVIVASIIVLSVGGLTSYFIFHPPIPRDAQYASILSAHHSPSVNIQNPVTINLTFTFGNGESVPNIYQRFHKHSLRLELLLWRPDGGYFTVYVEQNLLYNVTFPKVGEWTIEINLEHSGSNSSISIWDYPN